MQEPENHKITQVASIFFHRNTEYWIQHSSLRDLLDKGSPGERGMDQLTFFQLPHQIYQINEILTEVVL